MGAPTENKPRKHHERRMDAARQLALVCGSAGVATLSKDPVRNVPELVRKVDAMNASACISCRWAAGTDCLRCGFDTRAQPGEGAPFEMRNSHIPLAPGEFLHPPHLHRSHWPERQLFPPACPPHASGVCPSAGKTGLAMEETSGRLAFVRWRALYMMFFFAARAGNAQVSLCCFGFFSCKLKPTSNTNHTTTSNNTQTKPKGDSTLHTMVRRRRQKIHSNEVKDLCTMHTWRLHPCKKMETTVRQ